MRSAVRSRSGYANKIELSSASDLLAQIELLELIVPIKVYYAAREKYREFKPKHKESVRTVRRLSNRHKPFLEKSQ